MIYCFLLALLNKITKENIINTEEEINITNFRDYWVKFNNTNDCLIINFPKNSLFFVSTLTGYEAIIYDKILEHYQPLKSKLNPSPKDRLVYFKDEGYINVTSKVDDLNFTFHTLCLDKINVQYDHLIISSNPYETFDLLYDPERYPNYYSGNSTFLESHLIWQIGDNFTRCEIEPLVYKYQDYFNPSIERFVHPTSFSFPFYDDNNTDIVFTHIYIVPPTKGQYITSNSKLVYIEKVISMSYDYSSYVLYRCKPENNIHNYYTGYRAVLNVSKLQKTEIVSRGTNHINFTNHVYANIEEGITEIDFSIYNKIVFDGWDSIVIFPMSSHIRFNSYFNDSLLGFVRARSRIIVESGSFNIIDDSVINMKAICYFYYSNSRDVYYIISTSPTERLKISSPSDGNYSMYHEYIYIMASLQNINTTVIFTGNLSFKSIEFGKLKKINYDKYDESSNKIVISGPFIAHIPYASVCEFLTSPNENLKEGYVDDGRAYFRNYYNDAGYISKKYGFYKNITLSSTDINISFNDAQYCLVKTAPMVYAQTESYWSGEVVVPYLKDNKVGPYANRTSFYLSGSGLRFIYVMYKKVDPYFDKFVLNIRTAPFEFLKGHYNEYMVNCTRMIVFNEIPLKFGLNQKPSNKYKRIDIGTNEVVCVFPAVSHYHFGKTCAEESTNNAEKYLTYLPNRWDGEIAYRRNVDIDKTYCKNVTYYEYYGAYGYSIIRYRTTNPNFKAVSSFMDIKSPRYNYTSLGILPEEPLFYSDFIINKSFGIHSFGPNNYLPVLAGDDDDKDFIVNENIHTENVSISLTYQNYHDTVNMTKIKTLTINCPKSTIFFIHYINGYRATIYKSSPRKLIAYITEKSSIKIVNFGDSDGVIILKEDKANTKSLLDLGMDEFSYSYIILNSTYSGEKIKCDKIFISSKSHTNFTIKESDVNDDKNYNYSLSNENNFCLWFSYQFESIIKSYSTLTHSHMLLLDNKCEKMKNNHTYEKKGYNFFFMLQNESSPLKLNNTFAKYSSFPYNKDSYFNFSDYEQIEGIFNIEYNTSILSSFVEKTDAVEPKDAKKKTNYIYILLSVGMIAVIIVIIIVIVVYIKKSRKKISNFSNDSQNEMNSSTSHNNPDQNAP